MALASGRKQFGAVLTGDLVRSTRLTSEKLDQARATVQQTVEDISCWAPSLVVAPAEFFRGDSWQFVLGDARYFLRAAVYLRTMLRQADKEWDTRIGIGLGTFDKLDKERTSLSTGEAFILSGHQLDGISGLAGFSVGLPEKLSRLGWVNPMAALCSALVDQWSQRQAEIFRSMLLPKPPSQVELALDRHVTKQAISKALTTGGYAALLSSLQWIEQIDWAEQARRPTVRFI